MNDDPRYGLEMEFHVMNGTGSIDDATDILTNLNTLAGKPSFVPEFAADVIEINGDAKVGFADTAKEFGKNIDIALDYLTDNGFSIILATKIGDFPLKSMEFKKDRHKIMAALRGEEGSKKGMEACGTHIHIDQLKTEELKTKQFNTYVAMDPMFALSSSSPFFRGNNTINNYRVKLYRHDVFQDFPEHGGLPSYVKSFSERLAKQEDLMRQWNLKSKELTGKVSEAFTKYNTYWGPVRITDKNTIEIRSLDSTLYSIIEGIGKVYENVTDFIRHDNPDIRIAAGKGYSNDSFTYRNKSLILPDFNVVKSFENVGITDGIRHQELNSYLKNIVSFSQAIRYDSRVAKLQDMLEDKTNFSDEMVRYALDKGLEKDGKLVDAKAALDVSRYVANRFYSDFKEGAGNAN